MTAQRIVDLDVALKLQLEFDGHSVRMVGTPDSPRWVAADVCAAIEVADHTTAMRDFDDDEKGTHTVRTPGGDQEMLVVTEPGLYRLIRQSRSKRARDFERWLDHKIMPSVRKHGCYPPPDSLTCAGQERAIVTPSNSYGEIMGTLASCMHTLAGGQAKNTADIDILDERVSTQESRTEKMEERQKENARNIHDLAMGWRLMSKKQRDDVERRVRDRLAAKLKEEGYEVQVEVVVGRGRRARIDILTDSQIWEVKVAKNHKHGMGQLHTYAMYYPSHVKCLHLFGAVGVSGEARRSVNLVGKTQGIRVSWED